MLHYFFTMYTNVNISQFIQDYDKDTFNNS